MEGEIRVQVLKNGVKLYPDEVIAKHDRHPGINFNWEAVWGLVVEAVEALFGSPGFSVDDSLNYAKNVFSGSDYQYVSKGTVHVRDDSGADTIRVIFKAWSEDELKYDTCKTIAIPPQAVKFSETIEEYFFGVVYDLKTNRLDPRMYTFSFGAQDDGWSNDVAISSIAEVHFDKSPKALPLATPPVPAVPLLAHTPPDINVVKMVAERYAIINTLLAEYGINLGEGKNSPIYDDHYKWALNQKVKRIEEETTAKVLVLEKGDREVFLSLYTMISLEMAKMIPGSNSLDPLFQYNWAKGVGTGHLRNELLKKIYLAYEPMISVGTAKYEVDWTPQKIELFNKTFGQVAVLNKPKRTTLIEGRELENRKLRLDRLRKISIG